MKFFNSCRWLLNITPEKEICFEIFHCKICKLFEFCNIWQIFKISVFCFIYLLKRLENKVAEPNQVKASLTKPWLANDDANRSPFFESNLPDVSRFVIEWCMKMWTFNCSQTKFVEIILVLWPFLLRCFAWQIFQLSSLHVCDSRDTLMVVKAVRKTLTPSHKHTRRAHPYKCTYDAHTHTRRAHSPDTHTHTRRTCTRSIYTHTRSKHTTRTQTTHTRPRNTRAHTHTNDAYAQDAHTHDAQKHYA